MNTAEQYIVNRIRFLETENHNLKKKIKELEGDVEVFKQVNKIKADIHALELRVNANMGAQIAHNNNTTVHNQTPPSPPDVYSPPPSMPAEPMAPVEAEPITAKHIVDLIREHPNWFEAQYARELGIPWQDVVNIMRNSEYHSIEQVKAQLGQPAE